MQDINSLFISFKGLIATAIQEKDGVKIAKIRSMLSEMSDMIDIYYLLKDTNKD